MHHQLRCNCVGNQPHLLHSDLCVQGQGSDSNRSCSAAASNTSALQNIPELLGVTLVAALIQVVEPSGHLPTDHLGPTVIVSQKTLQCPINDVRSDYKYGCSSPIKLSYSAINRHV